MCAVRYSQCSARGRGDRGCLESAWRTTDDTRVEGTPPGGWEEWTDLLARREGRGEEDGGGGGDGGGGAGKKAVELPQPGAAHRHAFHPLLGDKGGEGGNKRLAPSQCSHR